VDAVANAVVLNGAELKGRPIKVISWALFHRYRFISSCCCFHCRYLRRGPTCQGWRCAAVVEEASAGGVATHHEGGGMLGAAADMAGESSYLDQPIRNE